MKKIIFTLILLASTICAFSEDVRAYMFQPDGSLYTENTEGELVWNSSIPAGSELKILKTKNEAGKMVLDEKDTKRTVNGKKIDCHAYKVNYNEKEFYVLSDRVSLDKSVAIVSNEAALYRSPDLSDTIDVTLAPGTFLTYDDSKTFYPVNTVSKTRVNTFVKVSYFDEKNYVIRTGYIKASNKESQADDLKAMIVLSKIKATKDVKIKNELLDNAKSLKVSKGITVLFDSEKKALSAE